MTRIIGIDPGSQVTGYGIIDQEGQALRYVASGCIRIKGEALAERLGMIFTGVQQVIDEYRPGEMAVERVFMNKNADSALKLGQARGAAICAGVTRTVPVNEYAAREIKQAVVGKGGAAKEQVQHMVRVLLSLDKQPPSDAADALAVAICHGHIHETRRRMGNRQRPQPGLAG
ncbi:MAG: crossover junction endodeoxyribonuclease RuvC [Halobacteria archaeon]|nr:crossover junction endodeoxyribonuclease RuvC [Halobacteria archaeon]